MLRMEPASPMRWTLRMLVVCFLLRPAIGMATAAGQSIPADERQSSARFQKGMPLTEALLGLQQQGLNLVFSSQLVTPGMNVEVEPGQGSPRQILEKLLSPHGMKVTEGPGGVLIVVLRPSAVSTLRGRVLSEEIVVQPSRISLLLDEPASPISLSREEIQALPHLGDDVFRILSLLPGTASSDFSAQFHIRGARRDELLILLDGQELYEPYHLRDFDNALSIVGASFLSGVQLSTAAFPVSYGDRMSGVLNMETVTSPSERRLHG